MSSLAIIQQNSIRYGFPILLTLGNVGNVCLIVIFTQKNRRHNPCSLYILTSAMISLIGMNWAFVTNLNALYQIPDPFGLSLTLCRLRGYILQTTLVLHRTMIIFACFDRFALSSTNQRIRSFSKKSLSIKLIIASTLFWSLITLQQPFFQTIQSNRCGIFGTYGLIFSIYQILLFGFLFPISMILPGVLLWTNLKSIRLRSHRVRPIEHNNIIVNQRLVDKRDLNLMKLVLAEVILTVLLSFCYPINTLYFVLASQVPNRTLERLQIEGFITFITQLVLLYLNYCVTFYLYIIMSKAFRTEIQGIVLKFFGKTPQHRVTTNDPFT